MKNPEVLENQAINTDNYSETQMQQLSKALLSLPCDFTSTTSFKGLLKNPYSQAFLIQTHLGGLEAQNKCRAGTDAQLASPFTG